MAMNAVDRKRLDEYLLEKKQRIVTEGHNSAQWAAWASEGCQFHVTISQVTHRAGPNGTLFRHEWPGSEHVRLARLTDKARMNLLILQIEKTRQDLARLSIALGDGGGYGRAIPEWQPLYELAQGQLADTNLNQNGEEQL